jgi:hypothetical protein
MTTDDLESMGRDLCRTILIYSDIYIPAELENIRSFLQSSIEKSPQRKNIQDLDKKKL